MDFAHHALRIFHLSLVNDVNAAGALTRKNLVIQDALYVLSAAHV
jgi:hypothetical protein